MSESKAVGAALILGALVVGGAFLYRKSAIQADALHRENRPQDFFHGTDISAMHTASADAERKIYSRLVAHASLNSNPLDRDDFGRKYNQVLRDYRNGTFKLD
jgi:hypothetical protein